MMIHPTAIVEDGAVIAKSAKIGAYTFVSSKAVIGENVEIMQGAQVCNKTSIDEGVRIFPYASVGQIPQDLKYVKGEDTSLEIGKNTTIREFATINIGTLGDKGITKIGENVLIMNYVHIAHDCVLGNDIVLANNATLAGHIHVGNGTVIGGLTPIHQFVHIGEHCMVAGASALSQDVPPYCLAEGNRATLRGLNLIGLRRKFPKEDIDSLQKAYKALFRSGKPIKEIANEILENEKNEKVIKLCNFVINTTRGIPYERKIND